MLCEIASELAPFYAPDRLDHEVRRRAPGLAALVGDRELETVIELASRPLGRS